MFLYSVVNMSRKRRTAKTVAGNASVPEILVNKLLGKKEKHMAQSLDPKATGNKQQKAKTESAVGGG